MIDHATRSTARRATLEDALNRQCMLTRLLFGVFLLTILSTTHVAALPPGTQIQQVASGFFQPANLTFLPDGRMLVVERRGLIRVIEKGVTLPTPFIDLRPEVTANGDRGLLGVTLDPNFETNGYVYLLYTVDPVYGDPDEGAGIPTYCRLTRYTADPAQNRNVADPDSRFVLIGQTPSEGIITCWISHSIGTVAFANDGSLLVGAGDGAHQGLTDAGGEYPACFQPPLFSSDEDVGAFRSQYLDSLSGKILRIDPATGLGLPDNPFYNGDPAANRSKVWVLGLRNPYRFSVKPGSGPVGTLYIGDVGWNLWEELNISKQGGENFGWPCYEGLNSVQSYQDATPAHSGCENIGEKSPVGPHVPPLMTWHHSTASLSTPSGISGRCAIGGVFYQAQRYHESLHGAYFFGDHRGRPPLTVGWIRALQTDEDDEFDSLTDVLFVDRVVDLQLHPQTGDVYFVTFNDGAIWRLAPILGDCNRDNFVDDEDVECLEECFASKPGSVAADSACSLLDFDGNFSVNCADFHAFLQVAEPGTAAALLLPIPDFVDVLLGLEDDDDDKDEIDDWDACRADVNADGLLDARDIAAYVQTLF